MRSPFELLRRRTSDARVQDEVETVLEPEGHGDTGSETDPPLASVTQMTPTVPRAPLDDYRGQGGLGRLPQCPDCGRFRLQMNRDGKDYQFDCLDCEASWSWSVHEPWPRTTARPDLGEPNYETNQTQTRGNQEK